MLCRPLAEIYNSFQDSKSLVNISIAPFKTQPYMFKESLFHKGHLPTNQSISSTLSPYKPCLLFP